MNLPEDKLQQGNSTLIFSIMLAAVTGIGVKVASDRLTSEANLVRGEKQSEWGENAIDAAVARAQALLAVRPGTPKRPGDIVAEPLSVNLGGKVALRQNSSSPSKWTLIDEKTLSLTMVEMGGVNLKEDQVVTLSFLKPIVTRSPVDSTVSLLRGFEVLAKTTIKRKDGSTFELTRPKQVIIDPIATGGGGDSSITECRLEGPGYTVEPNVSAVAKLFVKGRASLANVPRTAEELGKQIIAVNNVLTFDGNSYSVPASASLFFTRFIGNMSARVESERNDIKLSIPEDFDPNKWQEYPFNFSTPRPLTAVDGGTVTFPMWATVKLADGTWKKCDQTTVTVRQVTSCEFSAPSSPEIDYIEPNIEIEAQDYAEFAPVYARKGYDVPGCQDTCSSYKSSSACNSRSGTCYWYVRATDNIQGCYYKDPAAMVKCEKVIDPNKKYTLEKSQNKIPNSTTIKWNVGQGNASCLEMKAKILPPPDDRYFDANKKFIGDMPKITLQSSCSNKEIKIEVDSLKVPPGLYRILGSYKSSQGVGTCFASVKVGVDPCPFTNKNAASKNLPFKWNYFGEKGGGNQVVQPRVLKESEYYALSPTDVVDCATNDARCFYIPRDNNRTLFVHVDNPNLPTCSVVPVNRINLGCFAYGSQILLGDGRLVAGETVKKGDYVWNPVIKMPVRVEETTNGPESPALIKIETASGHVVRVTRNHPLLTTLGLKAAKDIKIGDHLRKIEGGGTKVTSIGSDKERGSFVWNVRLESSDRGDEFHYVLVDGIITGDLTLQEKLETALKISQQK
jgi:hypothetical protein